MAILKRCVLLPQRSEMNVPELDRGALGLQRDVARRAVSPRIILSLRYHKDLRQVAI
jgi:hypothetical protein